jgi:hypothetical protein
MALVVVLLAVRLVGTGLAGVCGLACGSDEAGPQTPSTGAGPGGGDAPGGAGGEGGASSSKTAGSGGDVNFTSGNGGGAGEAPCAVGTAVANVKPANILFVIDRSGSMNCNAPPVQKSSACELNPTPVDPGQPTKWQIVADALKKAIANLSPTTSVGIAYFNTDDACGVAQQPAVPLALVDAAQIAAVGASIDGVKPKGATPIVGGLTLGYAHMYADVLLPGNDFIVLLTDGAETCAADQQDALVQKTVPDAFGVTMRTFVIGAPGSEPARAFLSQIAWAGGTAKDPQCTHDPAPASVGDCHFDMTDPTVDFATELAKTLDQISGQALACEIDVPEAVGKEIDYDKVNVIFEPGAGGTVKILQDNKPCQGGANGWQYNADKTKIILCGPACATVQSDPKGKLVVELGCASEMTK